MKIAELLSLNLKALRTEKGWTQEQLAEIANLPFNVIQRAESKTHFPRGPRLTALARALKVPESRFFQDPDLDSQKNAPAPTPKQALEIIAHALDAQAARIGELESRTIPQELIDILADITMDEDKLRAAHDFLSALRSIPNSAYDEGKTG